MNLALKKIDESVKGSTAKAFKEATNTGLGVLFALDGNLYESFTDRIVFICKIEELRVKIPKRFKMKV